MKLYWSLTSGGLMATKQGHMSEVFIDELDKLEMPWPTKSTS